MGWLYYLIEANVYLSIFYAIYHFAFKQEPFYHINRWYLLSTSLWSFIIPFIKVSYTSPAQQLTELLPSPIVYDSRPSVSVAANQHIGQLSSGIMPWESEKIFLIIYVMVALGFTAVALKGIFKLIRLYRKAAKRNKDGVIYVELNDGKLEVFSFFNWLFLHPELYNNTAIMKHELVHIRQGHSFDVLFFESIRCLNWFNPCAHLLCRDAKLNHEYIADQQTSAQMQDKYAYANLLIQHAYLPAERISHSAFSTTQLEQRLVRLGKKSSKGPGLLKYLALFPVVLLVFMIAACWVEKSYGFINIHISTSEVTKTVQTPGFKVSKAASARPVSNKTIPPVTTRSTTTKPAAVISDPSLSELVAGQTTMDRLAREMAKKGKKLYAIDYELYWARNETNAPIRKVIHSIGIGTESQLFRGRQADTLYIDKGFYTIDKGTIKITTDNLWVGAMNQVAAHDKKLIVVDAAQRKIVAQLDRVDISTTGLIHSVVLNPYFGYGKNGVTDSVPDGYVDVKKRDANRRYISNLSNIYVREARITGNEIISNETRTPNEDRQQSGIIW